MSSEENLSCSVCHEVFKDPAVLSCSHSFCRDCLRSWWREKPTQECPVCKRRSSRSDPPRNLALRNLCEDYVQQRQQKAPEEEMCQVHSERPKLSQRETVETVEDLRDKLDKSLLSLKENLLKAKRSKRKIKKKADDIKKQFYQTERQIHAEFKKLHQFLEDQEESRMKTLKEEEEQKTQRMKDQMAAVSREIEALSETIRATEEQLRAPDVSFQLTYKAAMERVQQCPLLEEEPKLGPGALIDQAKHLGNLTFNIWINMKKLMQFTPVILDPNCAVDVVLSDDLTSFTFEYKELDQGSPENSSGLVYGSEGFDSGSHSWDVEVGDNEKWTLGVTADMFDSTINDEEWDIMFSDGEYIAEAYNEDDISLQLVPNPQKFRVCLDCDKHEISFYNLDTNAHIHTFTQISHKKQFPFFLSGGMSPIRILPQIFDSSCPV